MNLLGIDPGGTTGFCLWVPRDSQYYLDQVVTPTIGWAGIESFRNRIQYYVNFALKVCTPPGDRPEPLTIIVETFEFRHEERDRDKIDYSAAELNGVAKSLYLEKYETYDKVSMITQQASQAKGFWTDEKLRRLGLWKGTTYRHAMDAVRHVLYHKTFTLGDKSELDKLK